MQSQLDWNNDQNNVWIGWFWISMQAQVDFAQASSRKWWLCRNNNSMMPVARHWAGQPTRCRTLGRSEIWRGGGCNLPPGPGWNRVSCPIFTPSSPIIIPSSPHCHPIVTPLSAPCPPDSYGSVEWLLIAIQWHFMVEWPSLFTKAWLDIPNPPLFWRLPPIDEISIESLNSLIDFFFRECVRANMN